MQNGKDKSQIKYYAKLPLSALGNMLNGLTDKEVEQSKYEYGKNDIDGVKNDSLLKRIARAFINPFSVILIVLAIITIIVDILGTPVTTKDYTTVIIIGVMLIISGVIRLTQELRAKKITDNLIKIVNTPVIVKRNNEWIKIDTKDVVVGDLVKIMSGQRVPADIRITKTNECFISESAITGESGIQEKTTDKLQNAPTKLKDYTNIALAGTTVENGYFEGIVIAVGKDTLYGATSPSTLKNKNGYDEGANSIAKILIKFMLILAPLVFLASGITKGNWGSAFLFALSVAVGLTPELLPMVITACLAKGSFNMKQKQTIVKNVNAMQGFGNMDTICIDKTGTLTQDELRLEYYMDILGNESQQVLDCAYLNSFFHSGINNHLDLAILKTNQMPNKESYYKSITENYVKLDELPFDYNRKLSSVLVKSENIKLLISKGNVDDIIKHCKFIYYKGSQIEITEDTYKNAHYIVDDMLEDGMKVLAIATKLVQKDEINYSDENNLTLIGYIGFFDAPKKSAASAIEKLNDVRVKIKVLTGDNLNIAISVCRRLGIDTSEVITGEELDELNDNEMQIKVENTTIFAQLSPSQKAKIVDILKSNGHRVGYLADGVNDLPAVLKSDVGICVDTAVASVKECADVILLKKDLNVLESGIKEGRKAFANMSKYVKITASSNLGNIIAIVFASIFLPFYPMTSIQILLLNLLYDILCLVLPWDKVDDDLLRFPLEWSGKKLSKFMLIFGPISSVFDIITFLFLFCFLCPSMCGGTFNELSLNAQIDFISMFQTGWFLESMWTQILILYLLRTNKLSIIKNGPSKPVIIVTLLGIMSFTALAVAPIGNLIGLTKLPAIYYIYLLFTVACYLTIITIVKNIYIKKNKSLI